MERLRIIHFMNHFFAGVGGEEKGDMPLRTQPGPVGPGRPMQQLLGDQAAIVSTVYGGDNFLAQHVEEVAGNVTEIARQYKADFMIAGPAFGAGRYGFACAQVSQAFAETLKRPALTAMHPENPGVDFYRAVKNPLVYCLPTRATAAGMTDAIRALAAFVTKVASGTPLGPAGAEGYIPRGLRANITAPRAGADRALDMLEAYLAGRPFETEIPMYQYDLVPPPKPVEHVSQIKLGLISTAGLVPPGNPDHFRTGANVVWRKYSVAGLRAMASADWAVIHGGYDTPSMQQNPNFGLPLDVLRELEDGGSIGPLMDHFYSVTGNVMQPAYATRMGREMAAEFKNSGVDAVLMVST